MTDFDDKTPLPDGEERYTQAQGQADIDAFAAQEPVGAVRPRRSPRRAAVWIAVLAAVVILGVAAFLLIRFLPKEEESGGEDLPDTSVTLVDKQTDADGKEWDPVRRVHIASRIDEFTLAMGEDGVLRLEGEDALPVNNSSVEDLVEELACIVAEDTVATDADMAQYGLDLPAATVEVTYADDTTMTFEMASLAVGSHYYLRMGDENTVYLVDESLPREVMQQAEAFIGYTVIAAPAPNSEDENGTAVMKELSLTGAVRDNVITTVRRKEATDSAEFTNSGHLITAPYLMDTDTTVATNVFSVTGITASEVVKLHPTDDEKAEYGLDKPSSIAKIVLAVYTTEQDGDGNVVSAGYYNTVTHGVFLGKKNEDGNWYAMADTMDVVYLLEPEEVPWAQMTYQDFATQYLFLRNLTDLSQIACTVEGKTYAFCFERFPEAEELDDRLKVTLDGKQYPTDDFRTLYQVLMTICRTGKAPAAPSGEPLLTVRVTPSDSTYAVKEVAIYPYSGSVYIARGENGDTYKVTASVVDDAIAQIKNYLNGDPVVNKW